MRHNNDILAPFQLHDDWFQSDDNIAIGFPASVPVIVFVVVAGFEILRVLGFDFGVGEAVADARVEFVEGFPFQFVVAFGGVGEEAGGLDRSGEGRGPNCELAVVSDGPVDYGG